MKLRLSVVACLTGLLMAAIACHKDDPRSARRTDSVAPADSAAPAPNFFTRDGLEQLGAALRQRSDSKPSLLMLEIGIDHARAQLEASGRPGQIVQLEWRGERLSEATPVELDGKGTIAQNVFPLTSVELSTIPALVSAAVARIDPENGKVSHVLIRRNLPHDESIGMRVFVKSPLRDSHVDADARGKLVDPSKYP